MTSAQIVLMVFGFIWVVGWLAVLRDTGAAPDARWYQRIAAVVVLFFIWPYVAVMMNTDH